MYQRSLNFCKQPAVVVVNRILLPEIAETYGLRQEKGLIPGWDAVPRAHSVVLVTGCRLTVRDMAATTVQNAFYLNEVFPD